MPMCLEKQNNTETSVNVDSRVIAGETDKEAQLLKEKITA